MKAHPRKIFDGTRESFNKIVEAQIKTLDVPDNIKAKIYSQMTSDEEWEKFKKDFEFKGDLK